MLELAVGAFQRLGAENQYRGAANMEFLALVLACFFGCTWSVILHSDCHFYPSTHPVFDRFHSMQKRREKAWGISSRGPRHNRQMLSRVLSTAK